MAGRKSMLFSKLRMQSYILSSIIDNAINFDVKVNDRKVTTRDTLRADILIKTMVSMSKDRYKTNGSIDNRLIDSLLNREESVVDELTSKVLAEGYKFNDICNFVYYLVWFACANEDPKYKTLDEFVKNILAA